MSALAKRAICQKKTVSGSDICKNEQFLELKKMGAKLYLGHKKSHIKDAEMVIYSSSIKETNPELARARRQNIPTFSRSELLGAMVGEFQNVIAVSGAHGKTTASAMLGRVFYVAGREPTLFLGGEDREFSNYIEGNSKDVIVEACEYKKNILDIKPTVSVILNIDNDHMESYSGISDLIETFRTFSSDSVKIINADDENSQSLIDNKSVTFGIKNIADYQAESIRKNKTGGYSFTVLNNGVKIVRINLQCRGRHNVYNALVCVATGREFGINITKIKTALESFTGVKRRCENLGRVNDLEFYADYAHHPTEIRATLKEFLSSNENIVTVFQPHTFSRTKILMDEFIKSLTVDNCLIIYKTYPAREKYDKNGDAKTLYKKLKKCQNRGVYYAKNSKTLRRILSKNLGENSQILFLGAGDIYDIAKNIVKKFADNKN